MLFSAFNSILHDSIVWTELNGLKYCDVRLTIQFNFSHKFK